MKTFSTAQARILAGLDRGVVALLLELDHPDGAVRLSSLPADWTDPAGVTWVGGGLVLDFGEPFTRAGMSGGAITVTWTGADAALMALARDGRIAGRRLTQRIAFIGDDGARIGAAVTTFVGICETPEINPDPAGPTITVTAESRIITLRRQRPARYTPEQQRTLYPGDTGFDFVAAIQDIQLDF